ncbi:hypothetical protein OVA07_00280 [Novosphingobium sp. SL115]|uniref:hypothetical protein n=1 Tax=Novosphingobium sp. SL115 TaxID=2995150 RepID=UPI0022762237|nr:hypothetical protein [Novosphingobium sp. SL115]MCY1669460.1 hypothetical protein [Novosphingobium sp. SL115]
MSVPAGSRGGVSNRQVRNARFAPIDQAVPKTYHYAPLKRRSSRSVLKAFSSPAHIKVNLAVLSWSGSWARLCSCPYAEPATKLETYLSLERLVTKPGMTLKWRESHCDPQCESDFWRNVRRDLAALWLFTLAMTANGFSLFALAWSPIDYALAGPRLVMASSDAMARLT